MSGSLLIATLKIVVAGALLVSALHYRGNRAAQRQIGWKWNLFMAPLAVGFPFLLLFPVNVTSWGFVAWFIGSPLVWLANKKGWFAVVPWEDFGPLTYLDGVRARLPWQTAVRVRLDHKSGVLKEMVEQMHAELDSAQQGLLGGDPTAAKALDQPIVAKTEAEAQKPKEQTPWPKYKLNEISFNVKAAVLSALPTAKFDSRFSRFNIGGVPIPRDMEPVHFFLVGTTGSGKTVILKTILDQVERDGQRVVAIDSGADLADRYYNAERGDVILNPLDKRCVSWSPFAEIRNIADCMAVATSICPTAEGGDKFWSQAARIFIASIFQVQSQKQPTRAEIEARLPRIVTKVEGEIFQEPEEDYAARIDAFMSRLPANNGNFMFWAAEAEMGMVYIMLSGTQGASYAAPKNEKLFQSIRATAMERVGAYYLFDPNAGPEAFSIREFIKNDGDAWLFATYMDDQLDLLRDLIATVIDIAAVATLSLSQDSARRIVFSLDEFDSIGKVNSVLVLLAKGRKYGGMVIIGIQTTAQLFKTNGPEAAKSILGLFGTWIINRTPEPETAKYMSGVLGSGNYERRSHGFSHGAGGFSMNANHQYIQDKPAVAPSEIQNLRVASRMTNTPPEGYLKMGHWMPCRIALKFPPNRESKGGFTEAPQLNERRQQAEAAQAAVSTVKVSGRGSDLEEALKGVAESILASTRIIVPEPKQMKKASSHAPSAPSPQVAPNISAQTEETSTSDDVLGAAESENGVNAVNAADDSPDPLAALDKLGSALSSLPDD